MTDKAPDLDDMEKVNRRVLDMMNATGDTAGATATMSVLGLIAHTRSLEEVYRAAKADMKAGRYYCECEWSDDAQVYLSRCNLHAAIEKVEASHG